MPSNFQIPALLFTNQFFFTQETNCMTTFRYPSHHSCSTRQSVNHRHLAIQTFCTEKGYVETCLCDQLWNWEKSGRKISWSPDHLSHNTEDNIWDWDKMVVSKGWSLDRVSRYAGFDCTCSYPHCWSDGGIFLTCEDWGRMFNHSFPACNSTTIFFFKVDSLGQVQSTVAHCQSDTVVIN